MHAALAGSYYFNGITRESLWWENPNHAAVFVAACLALVWCIDWVAKEANIGLAGRTAVWLLDVALTFLCAFTFSRGGIIALSASLAYFCWLLIKMGASTAPIRQQVWFWGTSRMAILICVLITSGLTRRFAIIADGDGSVTHRIELWRGALALIAAKPFRGWGQGLSGLAYMQWLQAPSHTYVYGGMVNTYLEIAVERGMAALIITIMVIAFCLAAAKHLTRHIRPAFRWTAAAAGTALVAISIAGLFSTIFIDKTLFVGFVALSAIIIILFIETANLRTVVTTAAVALCCAVAVCGGLVAGGRIIGRRADWRMNVEKDGSIVFFRRGMDKHTPQVVFVPDGAILGPLYGKEIRRAVADIPEIKIFARLVYIAIQAGNRHFASVLLAVIE